MTISQPNIWIKGQEIGEKYTAAVNLQLTSFLPPRLLGKQWRSSFQNRISQFDARTYIDFKVVSLEDLDIAGTVLKVYKVDMSGFATLRGMTAVFKGTTWIEPQTMRLVRYDRELRFASSLVDATRIEVTNYRPARRS